MNTNDLSPKQRTVVDLTLMIHITSTDQMPKMTLAEQITYIELNSKDLTKKAIDSQLRSLAKKGWLEKNALGMFALTEEALNSLTDDRMISRELDHLTNDQLTEEVAVPAAEKPARVTAHTNCDHDTSKAARAKCRRLRAKNA